MSFPVLFFCRYLLPAPPSHRRMLVTSDIKDWCRKHVFGSETRLMSSGDRVVQAGYQYRHFGGFRLVLAALVMLQHFAADLAPEQLAKVFAPYALGGMAVLVFFAMSGFVITEAVDCVYRER